MTWTPASSRSLSQPPRSSGVCEESATAENLRAATPAAVPGSAVDPITLKPVDEVVVTTLVDQLYVTGRMVIEIARRSGSLTVHPSCRYLGEELGVFWSTANGWCHDLTDPGGDRPGPSCRRHVASHLGAPAATPHLSHTPPWERCGGNVGAPSTPRAKRPVLGGSECR